MKSLITALAFSAALICAAPSFAQAVRPFDLAQLSPEVRTAVEQARDAQRRALMAAARANGGGAGLIRFEGTAGDDYAGECSPCGGAATQRSGYGVLSWDDGEFYAGAHGPGGDGGAKHGYGVYVFANEGIYEGQFNADDFEGYGVFWNVDGTVRYQGRLVDGQPAQ